MKKVVRRGKNLHFVA